MIIIIIIIIIICHELGVDRAVLASCNNLFRCLPSRLRSFELYFSLNFGILLLFIIVSCRSQFDLYLLSLWSTWFYFQVFQNFLFFFVGKKGVPDCSKKFNLDLF
jgi:hypothetical protein